MPEPFHLLAGADRDVADTGPADRRREAPVRVAEEPEVWSAFPDPGVEIRSVGGADPVELTRNRGARGVMGENRGGAGERLPDLGGEPGEVGPGKGFPISAVSQARWSRKTARVSSGVMSGPLAEVRISS